MEQEVVQVAVTRDDGTVTILAMNVIGRGDVLPRGATWAAPGYWRREANATNLFDEVMRACATGARPLRWRVVQYDPNSDRTFRDALRDVGGELVVDMAAAREIHRERIRRERGARLAVLDADFMRALERDDKPEKQRIAAMKQALRDAPSDPRIDEAKTPDELKRVVPEAIR